MNDAPKAVFLSYASQDAEAAKRICEALRKAGVEVWFDAEGGLETGDEWDAKIRRQIKECVLFIPLISANTQARDEGYFRLEWDLAAERARTIASGVAFILPVVVDDTKEPAALVPDRFRTVQWTKLPGGHVPSEVLQRFLKLWSHRTGTLKHQADAGRGLQTPPRPEMAGFGDPALQTKRARWLVPGIAGVVALVVVAAWLALNRGSPPTEPSARRSAPDTPAPTAVSTGVGQLVAKAWEQMNKADLARTDWELADAYCRQATELDANDANAWAAWSQADSWASYHNFDRSPARREGARTKAARALQLAPNGYEPRLAHACQLVRGAGPDIVSNFESEAESVLRALLRENPDEPRALLALGILLRNTHNVTGFQDAFTRLARNPAFATLAWNELGWAEYLNGDLESAGVAIERSIALQPYWGNLLLKVILAARWRGDLDEAKAALERLPLISLQEDNGVSNAMQLRYWRREPEAMLALLAGIPRDWMQSNGFEGPTAYWSALAYRLAGRQAAAELQWRKALIVVESRLAQQPDSAELVYWKGLLQAQLGQRTEAAPLLALAREMGYRGVPAEGALALGDTKAALAELEEAAEARRRTMTAAVLRLDPTYDPLRALPRFQALRVRMEADPRYSPMTQTSSAAVPVAVSVANEKSVAVLAFANLSDDKANEYFSDGISEELLNVLAKVPGLRVAARTSAFYFKGKNVTAQEIGQKLGVVHLVEGSVRREGTSVRVMARLSRVDTGEQVWSDKFDGELKSILGLQDEIAGKIAESLKLRLGSGSRAAKEVNPEAHRLVLEGRFFWNLRTESGFARAEASFRKALEIDPAFAPAHAGLAELHSIRPIFLQGALDVSHDWRRADEEIDRALALDPGLAEPHAARGFLRLGQGRIDEGIAAFERAFASNPALMVARLWYVQVAVQQGRLDRAIDQYRQYLEVDPFSVVGYDRLASTLALAGRYEEALAALEHGLALRPEGIVWMHFNRAYILERLGRRSDALAVARATRRMVDQKVGLDFHPISIAVLQRLGRADEARDYAAELESHLLPDSFVHGQIRAALGQRDEAFPRLNNMPPNLWSRLYWDVMFEPFRSDPRFEQLLVKLGCAKEYKVARETLARMQGEAEAKK